jgi:hypothetical protein
LIRKKFLMRCETWLFEPLICLLVDSETPEKVRFSVVLVWADADELKSCVMVVTRAAVARANGVASMALEGRRGVWERVVSRGSVGHGRVLLLRVWLERRRSGGVAPA